MKLVSWTEQACLVRESGVVAPGRIPREIIAEGQLLPVCELLRAIPAEMWDTLEIHFPDRQAWPFSYQHPDFNLLLLHAKAQQDRRTLPAAPAVPLASPGPSGAATPAA